MAKHSVVLGKSQLALLQLASDIRDQLTQAANNGFQQRVAVIAEECGAPKDTKCVVVDGEEPGTFRIEWETPDIAPTANVAAELESASTR